MLIENVKSGLVVICSYMSDPSASQKGVSFILFSLSRVVRQSSIKSIVPGGGEVIAGKQEVMLNCFRRRSQ